MTLDAIDVRILEVLQQNARVSISELSKQVNLSLSAVSERLKKLETSGIIERYTTIINPSSMEKELSVLMLLSLENSAHGQEIREFFDKADEVLECHRITGEYDYALKITTKNTSTLERLMSEIKNLPGVRHTQTNVILSTSKNNYSILPIASK